eukprot:TRINITY_DN7736_c0_g1_i1.p1 TRINITY_DN7736_c0_g1~~TRINITY_DN7736_c0_g1_i1.p1  ORF type:complete len:470 (+),score=80.61 TRINITY_DN7736_c0_g1_i1:80-1411(+)
MAYSASIWNTKEDWKKYMGPLAAAAEDYLWTTARYGYMKCEVCGTGAQGMETHIVGAAHYKKLGGKFNWKVPPLDEANDLSKPWVEKLTTSKGEYYFNHVTGAHGWMNQAGGNAQPPQAPAVSSPYQAPSSEAPSVSSPYQAPSSEAPYRQPSGIPSETAAGNTQQPLTAAADDRAFEKALTTREKGGWRRYMEPLAAAAEAALQRASGSWDYACTVCEQANTRGLADHVPSEKHWKKLGEKLNWVPPPVQDAHDMSKPWVQRIQTTRGVFLFNHVTGAHGIEGQASSAASAAPCAASMCSTAATCPPCAPSMCSTAAPCPAPDLAGGKLNLAHWLWRNTARVAAEQVEELVSHRDFEGGRPQCLVCSSALISKEHVLSLEHFNALQQKCALMNDTISKEAMEGNNAKLEDSNAPWVQKLSLHHRDYHYNHITAAALWHQGSW